MDSFIISRAPAIQAQAPAATPAPTPQAVLASPQAPAPVTAQDVANLLSRRTELSNQLSSATSRRGDLSRALRTVTDPVDRTGLEQRLATLDQHIGQLDADIAGIEHQLALAPASARAGTTAPPYVPNRPPDRPMDWPAMVFIIFVLGPLSVAFARRMWRRPAPAPLASAGPESAARLERIEQAVDAMAIEVERVSEGQRFMTRVLTEQPPRNAGAASAGINDVPPVRPALGAGEAPFEAVRAKESEEVR